MRSFQLSPRAYESLDDIHIYSAANWGNVRGSAYVEEILARCRELAAGQLPSQVCKALFAGDLRANLRFIRSGRHIVIFTETALEVHIVDILHQSTNLSRRLKDIP